MTVGSRAAIPGSAPAKAEFPKAMPVLFNEPSLPSECPVCGAYSLAPESSVSILLAVCDVLVVKAMEKLGTFIVRGERNRYNVIGDRPFYTAHTLWQPSDALVDKAIRGAWDVVPLILDTHGGCCDYDSNRVTVLLDSYVHDLAITGTKHNIDELAYRLRSQLDLPVYRTTEETPS